MRIQALLAAGLMDAFAACSGNNPPSPTSGGGGPDVRWGLNPKSPTVHRTG